MLGPRLEHNSHKQQTYGFLRKIQENIVVALRKALIFLVAVHETEKLLGRRVLGDGFGTLTNSVFGQFTGQQETYGSLDFPTGDG